MMFNPKFKTKTLVKIAILSALAFVIQLFEIPLPFMPGFLKIDLSEIPVLLAAFAMGPMAAIFVELIKNLLHLFKTTTMGIGDIANFIVGISIAVPAALIYKRNKTRKGALLGLAVGTVCMVTVGCVLNYFVILPLYAMVLGFPYEAIIGMGKAANPMITDINALIIYGFLPFNIIKCIVISVVTLLTYKYVSPLLHRD